MTGARPWIMAAIWIALIMLAEANDSPTMAAALVVCGALHFAAFMIIRHIDERMDRINKRLDDANIL